MFNFVICSVFKNEAHILDEWINHYLRRDVDHIYLINDNSTDNFMSIIEKHSDKVTVYNNDIVSKEVGRQSKIYEKYFRPLINITKWMAIIDLDEFLWSPSNQNFKDVLSKYNMFAQLEIEWLIFGSNGHIEQPKSAVEGFTKRAKVIDPLFYKYKSIIQAQFLIKFDIHIHKVRGITKRLNYDDSAIPPLVINHYWVQSYNFYMTIKSRRGDCDNWYNTHNMLRNEEMFRKQDINEVTDLRLLEQNRDIIDLIKK